MLHVIDDEKFTSSEMLDVETASPSVQYRSVGNGTVDKEERRVMVPIIIINALRG